jgi:hypothetical protein
MSAPRFRFATLPFALTVALTAGSLLSLNGCNSDPYCLDCRDGEVDVAPVDTGPVDTGTDVSVRPDVVDVATDTGVLPDGCTPGAPELCNGIDDNCDGQIDEGIDLQTHPRHCGACGNACNLPHAVPACVAGECVIAPGGCDSNFYDLNGDPSDGCEYACIRIPGATDDVTCDRRDDNCNGRVDEDVDLCADARNCGACGTVCRLDHAIARCARTAEGTCGPSNTRCEIASCEPGFYDINGNPADGCEYACLTTGPEVCDGRDNNCDGVIDEGNPGGGENCGTDVGACSFGTTRCVNGTVACENATGPVPETCNGIDDDCNGQIDDGNLIADARVGVPCGSSVGDCRPGRMECTNGAPVCTGQTGPSTEVCDGRDNNCNGLIDDGVPDEGSCGSTVGLCSAGRLTCQGGAMRCVGGTGPSAEVCDCLDNDCDGVADNGCDFQNDVDHCGSCTNRCMLANAANGCRNGQCVIIACAPGFFDRDGNPANGCEYACNYLGPDELCNGLDDDCDGMIDENVTAPTGFCRTAGPCAGTVPQCRGTQGFVCQYPSSVEVDPSTGQPVAIETRCDGVDNNCNGAIDESFTNLNLSCSNGMIGACNTTGRFVCNGTGTGTTCNAPAGPGPRAETCNGIDDDCDGMIDENRNTPGSNPSFVSTAWVQVTTGRWIMQYEASRTGATFSNQGTASNRACSASGVLPWTNLTYSQAQAACAAAGATLCSEADWQRACRSSSNACTWSYGTNCTTYNTTACNSVDNDGDSSTPGVQNVLLPTGSKTGCFATFGSAGVYDMSGNAREFTLARSTDANALRGGSYNNLAFGTSCTFDWTVVDNSFALANTGFRCCYAGTQPP